MGQDNGFFNQEKTRSWGFCGERKGASPPTVYSTSCIPVGWPIWRLRERQSVGIIQSIFLLLRALFMGRAAVAVENLALRQQVAVLKKSVKRPKLRPRDRVFWTWLVRVWPDWRSALIIVKPDTVVRWHRQGFKLYWRWKSRARGAGRPMIESVVRALIQQMSTQNPTWSAPRIQSELTLLGHNVAESTVAKYMVRHRKPPSQTWRTFLKNHVHDLIGIDFFTVPTVTFRVLYCFVVLRHDRRHIVHFNVTANPTAQWATQQIIEAFPFDDTPGYMIRDRDGIYGDSFQKRVRSMGIEEIPIAPRSPWQNGYVACCTSLVRLDTTSGNGVVRIAFGLGS